MSELHPTLSALHRHGLLEAPHGFRVEAAGGGLNTRVLFVLDPGGERRLTVRALPSPPDLDREAAALAELSRCPGVPRLRLAAEGLLVHDYLKGRPLPLAQASAPAVARLAASLACIHGRTSPTFNVWPSLEPRRGTRRDLLLERRETLRRYTSFAGLQWTQVEPRLGTLFERLAGLDLTESSWGATTFARLHGDMSPGNILWTGGGVGLIDWEYTRAGDPAEELAYLLTEQPIPDERVALLRARYRDAGGDATAWARVPPYAVFTALDSSLWWMDRLLREGANLAHHPEICARIDAAWRWLPIA